VGVSISLFRTDLILWVLACLIGWLSGLLVSRTFPPIQTHSPIVAGFKWSIIDYAQKIENLFAKMEGVRTLVLPPNREVVDKYLTLVWILVHTLTAAASSLSSGLDGAEKFKMHLEAEEARLGKNLRAVDYVIDGIDTLKLITGGGRIEKVRI